MKEIIFKNRKLSVSYDGEKIYYNGKLLNQPISKTKRHSKGYKFVSAKNKPLYVHHLVAHAYVPNPKPVSYNKICHIDGNTLNNNADNLQWANDKMVFEIRKANGHLPFGEYNPRRRNGSKISHVQALRIAVRLDRGEAGSKIAKEYNVSEMAIQRIRVRYCRKKTATRYYTDEQKQSIIKLLDKHSPKVLAQATGIRYQTLLRWRHKKYSGTV